MINKNLSNEIRPQLEKLAKPKGSSSSRRPQKIVRKTPLSQRILAYPLDLYLSVNEKLDLIDWDGMSEKLSAPVGITGSLLVLICRLYFEATRSSPSSKLVFTRPRHSSGMLKHSKTTSYRQSERSSMVAVIISSLLFALLVISTINICYTFTHTRKYSLLSRPLDNPPDTPSASLIALNDEISSATDFIAGDKSDSDNNKTDYRRRKSLSPLLNLSVLRSVSPFSSSEEVRFPDTWQLNVWTPPLFNLALISYFSPLHVLLIFYLPLSVSTFITVPAVSLAVQLLINRFQILIKDKNIIYSEVLNEYDKKLVHPKLSIQRRDVSVGTDSGPAMFYPPAINHVFKIHDVRPNKTGPLYEHI
ncbi:hypothetical protein NADFUDRAFT_49937 [Nadsonia fulvescens var. elongata DSM 6958]|uniref:Nuclear rim protein 1 n=1 Tax=Nadsonia fulvescens var. elongata DSM 6958 TaxID=857566 RepID=A0A1E3PQD8_9ASCO|nr:hypothetical protein NADFUDRAFT_49937 [Nadsonia fulvescens var. elongata DSM 6958]